jgi:NitT/TauT family transport system substrate-binding protein
MMRSLRIARIALTALFALPAPLLGAEEALKVLAPPSTAALPLLRLAAQRLPAGVRLSCETFLSHPQALALVLRGEADLLLTGTSQGWENYLAGGPLVMVNTGIWAVSSLIGTAGAPPLARLSELAGKRLALPFPGSPLDFQTRYILARQGLDPDRDLRIVYLAFGQSVPLLLQGKLDAAALPEPLATDLVLNRGLSRLLEYGQAWAQACGGDPRSPQVSLFATRAFLAKNSGLVRRLVEVWARASTEVAGDPQGAARAHAAALGLAPEVVASAAAQTLFWVPSAEENFRRVNEYYEAVKDYLPGDRARLGRDFFLLADAAP